MNSASQKILERSKFGIKLGLDNIKIVLDELDNPQDKLKIIHVAGTNGKGSVSSIISSCLQAAGYNIGKYTSPYLRTINEMFSINDRFITDTQICEYYNQIINAEAKVNISLTQYEFTSVLMFLFAASMEVDFLVLEVGLGGRLDATNVVHPIVAVITNISLDHKALLGDTIQQIAFEKAGIIKTGVPLFTAETKPEALAVFKFQTTMIHRLPKDFSYNLNYQSFETNIEVENENYTLNLFGNHQVDNFLLAKAVLDYLGINSKYIKSGASKVHHQARLELMSPNIIFDGAHNPAAAAALVSSLQNYPHQINVIFSILKDKDIEGVVSELRKLSTKLTFIPLDIIERGMSIGDIQTYNIEGLSYAQNLDAALDPKVTNLICGTFSLYPLVQSLVRSEK